MTGFAHADPPAPPVGVAAGLSELSRRLILPVAALASLFAGLALLLEPVAVFGPYAPYVLFVVGFWSLAGSVALSYPKPSALEPRPSGTSAPETSLAVPASVGHATPSREREPQRGTGAGSEWRVLLGPPDPGDETWLSWLPRERRRLGPSDRGIVPGVVPSPGRAGNLVAFPVRNLYGALRVPSDPVSPPASLPAVGPHRATRGIERTAREPSSSARMATSSGTSRERHFTPEELDRLFPPNVAGRTIFFDGAPQRVGRVSRFEPNETSSTKFVAPNGTEEGDENELLLSALEDEVDRTRSPDPFEVDSPSWDVPTHIESRSRTPIEVTEEISNPIPPHLRRVGPLVRTRGSASPPSARPQRPPRSVCASCSKVVLNLRMSGPCSRCLRPICADCLREALTSYGHGWCADCVAPAAQASVAE